MKKQIVAVFTILSYGGLYALPVGNPSDASLLCEGLFLKGHYGDFCDSTLSWCDGYSVRIGFYGDYVCNRHMEIDRNIDSSVIEKTALYTNAGFVTVNLWDRFDFFTILGATNLFIKTNASAFGGPAVGNRFELETETDFSWSIGVRGTLWEYRCTTIGFAVQYFSTRPDIERITLAASSSVYPDDVVKTNYEEWQLEVGISHRINIVVPYIAVKFAHATLEFEEARLSTSSPFDVITLFDLENEKDIGYAIGVTLVDCKKTSITAEARFGDEKALYVNGQIRF